MWFLVWTKKLKLEKLVCRTIYIHILMIDIFIMFHMILRVCPIVRIESIFLI